MYTNVTRLPIEKRIEWLFNLAERHGTTFRGPRHGWRGSAILRSIPLPLPC